MAGEKTFVAEVNELITRYINAGSDPQEIIDELTREANLIFAHHNLVIGDTKRTARAHLKAVISLLTPGAPLPVSEPFLL